MDDHLRLVDVAFDLLFIMDINPLFKVREPLELTLLMSEPRRANCDTHRTELRFCARCKTTRYCSRTCQKGALAYSPRGVQGFVDVERTGDESIRVESSSATGPLDFRAADRTTIKSAKSERASCFRTYRICVNKKRRIPGWWWRGGCCWLW